MEVFPDFSSSTPEEKWKSGRWSPGKDGGEEEEKLLFLSRRSNFQATGVCVWWGAFTQCGDIPLLMQESESESKKGTVFCGIVNNVLFVVFDIYIFST